MNQAHFVGEKSFLIDEILSQNAKISLTSIY